MREILIDATSVTDRLTGIERYTREVTKRITETSTLPTTILVGGDRSWIQCAPLYRDTTILSSPFAGRLLTEQLWIPRTLMTRRPLVCLFPGFPPSPAVFRFGSRIVRTVHDAVPWRKAETLSWKARLYHKPLETLGIPHYDIIVTVSEFSQKELIRRFSDIASRIVVASDGVSWDRFGGSSERKPLERIRRKYDLPRRFGLFVGTIEPRKNLPHLVEVLSGIRRDGVPLSLVIVGRAGWGAKRLLKTIHDFGMSPNVNLLGAVEDEDLPGIYRLATVFLFPSLYEGFGLPILEAMASGVPVIASNSTAIPEVAGDAAILVPPEDVLAWRRAIYRVLEDRALARRMGVDGIRHARQFSWERVGQRILPLLQAPGEV